jgi:uncharacterized protein YacL
MNNHLLAFALALATNELIHNVLEAQQVRKKVGWLRLSIAGKKYVDKLPFQVDTRAKSYALSFIGLVIPVMFLYVAFSILNWSLHASLIAIIVLLVLAYASTAILLDQYHVEIARVTKPFQKKIK